MALLLKRALISQCDYPSQPRSKLDPEHCRRLGESMRTNGQQVPLIGYTKGDRFIICDGGCRLEGARLAGLTELLVMDLGKEPTRSELLLAQAAIDQHKQALPPVDQARLFQAIIGENGWTARRCAEAVGVSEAQISRALALLGLPEEVQRLVNDCELDASKAYLISQESDPVKQADLARRARTLTRAALTAQIQKSIARTAETPAVRLARVKIALPGGATVTVAGPALAMADLIRVLADTLKAARAAADARYDVKTWQRMMADRAQGSGGSDHV